MSRAEHGVDPVEDGVGAAEVGRQLDRASRGGRRRSGTCRCRRGGTGRWTASGRRRRTAARPATATSRQSARSGRRRRRRCVRRARPGSGRCPGTRRAVAAGSAPRSRPRTCAPWVAERTRRAGQHEQVVELQPSGFPARGGGREGAAGHAPKQPADDAVEGPRARRLRAVAKVGDCVPHRGDAARPVGRLRPFRRPSARRPARPAAHRRGPTRRGGRPTPRSCSSFPASRSSGSRHSGSGRRRCGPAARSARRQGPSSRPRASRRAGRRPGPSPRRRPSRPEPGARLSGPRTAPCAAAAPRRGR